MSTYTQIKYQVVFSTKGRERALGKSERERLFKFIWGVFKNKNCHLYRINGVEDHVHILFHLHPNVALSELIKDIKLSSTAFIKENEIFPLFRGWQDGYGAFTYSIKEKDNLIEYIKNQEIHHQKFDFREEYRALLQEFEIEFNEKYLL